MNQQLEDERENRNQLVQSTYDKLYPLWAMLGVQEHEMDEFVNRWVGSTSDVVRAVSPPPSSRAPASLSILPTSTKPN